MTQAHCPKCGSSFATDDKNAGGTARCACGAEVTIPAGGGPSSPGTPPRPTALLDMPLTSPPLAMLCSILGIFIPLLGVAGIGIRKGSIEHIDRAAVMGRRLSGRGEAQAAVVLGWVTLWGWLALLLVALISGGPWNDHQRGANRVKNGTQVSGIVKNLILWSAANTGTDDFPGAAWATTLPANGAGAATLDRAWPLLAPAKGDPLSPKLLINPVLMNTDPKTDQPYAGVAAPGSERPAVFTSQNMSYAFLDARSVEWKNNTNPGAPVVCDKLIGKGSAWSKDQWQGHVGWGDGHVSFEITPVFSVTIQGTTNSANNIWAGNSPDNLGMVNP